MASRLNPYISFTGNARQAMEFYKDVLGGTLALHTFGDYGDNMAVSLSGDDADELHGYWSKLADGAAVTVPLEKQMWGDEFGMCIDKFGVAWMVNVALAE